MLRPFRAEVGSVRAAAVGQGLGGGYWLREPISLAFWWCRSLAPSSGLGGSGRLCSVLLLGESPSWGRGEARAALVRVWCLGRGAVVAAIPTRCWPSESTCTFSQWWLYFQIVIVFQAQSPF